MARCELTYQGADLALKTPYDQAFVAALHAAVPRSAHTWNKPYWLIDPLYTNAVVGLVETFYGERLTIKTQARGASQVETRALYVEYLGRAKSRDDGSAWASGYQPGDDRMRPSLVFPEQVLRAWFSQEATPDASGTPAQPQTHYSTLGIPAAADAAAIRAARNRLAKQWHPDVCREPGAADMFKAIQAAYELLSDPQKRRRYDAGLQLQASLSRKPDLDFTIGRTGRAIWHGNGQDDSTYGYRAPLRCGMVLAEAVSKLGRLQVQKIIAWDDITRADGHTLVSSWPAGADMYEVRWF